ncbi:phosphoribosyltransferase family protein [Temperatibacter marinus]|uniref:Phosphoribosyltransferase family protein n=1 Tax=Temperatibacter marinus TaxID=1456591 RepID=A0AA52EIW2_9PROT|nr:phosphoribosyltransferase family protein [Temperatibacter marinus]WND03978.1 phosphoribosyltransferase family protein [Temperatibacter marinus]
MDPFFDWGRAKNAHEGVEPLFTAGEIVERVEELATLLSKWMDDDEEPLAQVIMNGAVMFGADLVRALSSRGVVLEMDFIHMQRNSQAGTVDLIAASNRPVTGRHVLIIDDIFDTGRTLQKAKDHFYRLGADQVTSVVLLDKSNGKETATRPEYIGFECPNVFVIGYGMDIGFRYRELPFVGKLGTA